jgi:hypothetical protein|tara:strand:- start:208 stop:867 length:660 start_codon:yes stop_codon:yes gene_type:complete
VNRCSPPRIAEALLERVLPVDLKEPLLGDLEEEFQQIQFNQSKQACQIWYWRQALLTSFHYFNQTQKALIMFAFSVLFFAALTIFAMELSGGTSMFFDVPSLIITLPPALVFTLAVTSPGNVKQAFSCLFSGHVESLKQVKNSVMVFDVLGTSCLWLGALMTLLGWVAMGSSIEEVAVIGPAFAVSVLTLMYAMGIKLVCYVASQRIIYLGQGLSPHPD